jgi:hypothetical protein
LPTRERRRGSAFLAVATILVGLALGGYVYVHAGAKTPVVVVAAGIREGKIPSGHVITRADLSTVEVAGPVTAVAGSHLQDVVGQVAVVTLLPNMLVQRSMVTSSSPLRAGQARVGVALTSGQIPADGVEPGDTVEVLQVPAADSSGPGSVDPAQVLVASAVVWSTRPDPARSGGTLLTLTIPDSQVADVASAGAAGQITVVAVPPPS